MLLCGGGLRSRSQRRSQPPHRAPPEPIRHVQERTTAQVQVNGSASRLRTSLLAARFGSSTVCPSKRSQGRRKPFPSWETRRTPFWSYGRKTTRRHWASCSRTGTGKNSAKIAPPSGLKSTSARPNFQSGNGSGFTLSATRVGRGLPCRESLKSRSATSSVTAAYRSPRSTRTQWTACGKKAMQEAFG